MQKIFLRSGFPYNYDTNVAGDESGLKCEDPTLAKDSMREECDINTIVRRFGLTGQLPQAVKMPTYGTFDGVFDFQTAMNAIREADESFMAMPAEIRARFHNDPQEFVEFCSDEKNRDEALKMGLVEAPDVPVVEQAPQALGAPKDAPKAP